MAMRFFGRHVPQTHPEGLSASGMAGVAFFDLIAHSRLQLCNLVGEAAGARGAHASIGCPQDGVDDRNVSMGTATLTLRSRTPFEV